MRYETLNPSIGSPENGAYRLMICIPELEAFGFTVEHSYHFIVAIELSTTDILEVLNFTEDENQSNASLTHVEYVAVPKGTIVDYMNLLVERYDLANVAMRHDYFVTKYNMSPEDDQKLALMLGREPTTAIKYNINTNKGTENHVPQ